MGTSIPRKSNETSSKGQGEIKYYTLSPEEIDAIIGKPIPKGHHKPIGFRKRTKEDYPVAKVNKDQYLEKRASGLTRSQAAVELGTTLSSLETYWLAKVWGIKSEAAENAEIVKYKARLEGSVEVEEVTALSMDAVIEVVKVVEIVAPIESEVPVSEVGKAKLTKKQAEAIESIKAHSSIENVVRSHVNHPSKWVNGAEAMDNMPLDTLIKALYIGYEVELTVEERLFEVFNTYKGCGTDVFANIAAYRSGMKTACDIAGMQVPGINVQPIQL